MTNRKPVLRHAGRAFLLSALAAPLSAQTIHVVSKGDPRLFAIDVDRWSLLASVPTGVKAHEVVRAGKDLFVPIYSDGIVGQPGTNGRTIEVRDARSLALKRVIDLGEGIRPHSGVVRGPVLWLTAEIPRQVWAVDRGTGAVRARLATGAAESHGIALAPDGRTILTANVGQGSVSIIDARGRRAPTVLPLTKRVQRVTVAADGRWAVTHDVDQPRLALIDVAGRRLRQWVPLPTRAYGSVLLPGGRQLLLTSPWTKQVMLLDTERWQVTARASSGCAITNLVASADGRRAYGTCPDDGDVVELTLPGLAVSRRIAVAKGIEGLVLGD